MPRSGECEPPLRIATAGRVSDVRLATLGRLPEEIRDVQGLPEAAFLPATKEAGIGAHLSVPVRLASGELFPILSGAMTRQSRC